MSRPPCAPDYPAAHSMDTEWFAVDRDGHVALFVSGENGAVADGAAQLDPDGGPDMLTVADVSPATADRSSTLYDWEGHRRGGTRHESQYLAVTDDAALLMFVRDLSDLADDIAAGEATPAASTAHAAAVWPASSLPAIERAHARKACLRCTVLTVGRLDGRRPGDVGLFLYKHVHDGGTPMPYVRLERPSRPLALDALPAAVRVRIGGVRFESVSFADELAVQPFEHVAAFAYGGGPTTYVDVAGEERAIDGRETDAPDEVLFYGVGDEHGYLSNFAPAPVRLKGRTWPTTEHYFQAQKFAGTRYESEVRAAKTPMLAARLGRDRKLPLRRDWESVKVSVMREAVTAKFEQHHDLRARLLATGDARIVEHTDDDSYWGDGGDGSGQNVLGRILVEVRAALRAKPPR